MIPNFHNCIEDMWKTRYIYWPVLLHFCDTLSNLVIIVDWGCMGMIAFFIAATLFFILYRVISAINIIYESKFKKQNDEFVLDTIFALLDLYIIKVISQSIDSLKMNPTSKQKTFQFIHTVFESIPQTILQGLFIVQNVGTCHTVEKSFHLKLAIISCIISLISISSKYVWLDDLKLSYEFYTLFHFKIWYFIWRIMTISLRFIILVLLWRIFGPTIFACYCAWQFFLW
eukprot:169754_1